MNQLKSLMKIVDGKEIRTLLTQEEVDNLPDGAEVMVSWAGVGRPYRYVIGKHFGKSCTTFIGSDGKRYLNDIIDGVSTESSGLTNVWLEESHENN